MKRRFFLCGCWCFFVSLRFGGRGLTFQNVGVRMVSLAEANQFSPSLHHLPAFTNLSWQVTRLAESSISAGEQKEQMEYSAHAPHALPTHPPPQLTGTLLSMHNDWGLGPLQSVYYQQIAANSFVWRCSGNSMAPSSYTHILPFYSLKEKGGQKQQQLAHWNWGICQSVFI